MGGALCQNGIGGFADSWFSDKNVLRLFLITNFQRGLAISLLTALNGLGTILSFLYPFIFISDQNAEPDLLKTEIKSYTMSQIFIFGTCTFLSVCFYFNITQQRSSAAKILETDQTVDNSEVELE